MSENVIIIIQNLKGLFLIHQKHWDKEIYPSKFGIGCDGIIKYSEGPIKASIRILYEELGIQTIHAKYILKINNNWIFYLNWNKQIKKDNPSYQFIDWIPKKYISQLNLCDDTKIFWERFLQLTEPKNRFNLVLSQ